MNILTLAMHVPDSRASINVAQDGLGLITQGLKYVCNPFDEFAIEQAVQLRESRSDVEEIVAITIGPPTAVEALRVALAMGADRAVHICEENMQRHDEIFLAEAVALAINKEETDFSLIFTGKQSIDNDTGELGPALAEFLGLPHIGAVVKLEVSEDATSCRANRRIEGAEEVVEGPLPIVITCEKGLVEPRYPSLPNLMKAKKKPLDSLSLSDLSMSGSGHALTQLVKLTPPVPRPPCKVIEGEPAEMAHELVRLLREEAKVI